MRWRTANNNRRSKDLRERLHAHGLERILVRLARRPFSQRPRLVPTTTYEYSALISEAATGINGVALFSIAHPAKS